MEVVAYTPPRMLRHADIQAALANSAWRRRRVFADAQNLIAASEDRIVECGGGVRLLAQHTANPQPNGRVVILLHGWEGSSRSLHVVSAADRLWRAGFRIVRINMRDHGNTHHLNREIFHSCRLAEMVDATRWVADQYPDEALYLAGYSLGGNFALRIATVATPSLRLARVAAICPVLEPEETMIALDSGLAIYRRYYLGKWRRSLERKAEAFPADYTFGSLARFTRLRAMTEYFVAQYTEFPDLKSYLDGYSLTGDRLSTLNVPSDILLADDDPVVPVATADRLARSPALTVRRTRWGGHCGYLGDFRLRTWSDDFLVNAFSETATA
ncbi:MAG: alpha/beta fold hydrolase [Gammaproteobacteria bacterium]